MEIIGFALGILIGVTLGLIGSGGSILTIPVLVYFLHILPANATTYSLFIVGFAALAGSIKGAKDNLLDYKMVLYFGLPSLLSTFIMRKFLVPLLPDTFFTLLGFTITKNIFIMLVFAVLMIFASVYMLHKTTKITQAVSVNLKTIATRGLFVGLITGFVGVGGGFLIIPTLIFSAKLPMNKAVATSLIIVALNSLFGFVGSLGNTVIEWRFLLIFTVFAIIGIFLGIYFSKKISSDKLKPAFGYFVLITGIYIIFRELLIK